MGPDTDVSGLNKQKDNSFSSQAAVAKPQAKQAFVDKGSFGKADTTTFILPNPQIQTPLLNPPGGINETKDTLSNIASRLHIPFYASSTPKQLIDHLSNLPSDQPIPDTDNLTVKDLLQKGTFANNILSWCNAPTSLSISANKLSLFTPTPIEKGSSLDPSYVVSKATANFPQITVENLIGSSTEKLPHLDPKIRQAQAVYTFISHQSSKAAEKNDSNPTGPTLDVHFKNTAPSPEQMTQEINELFARLPEATKTAKNTKAIMQFLENIGDDGSGEKLSKLPADTPIPGTNPPLKAADFQDVHSPHYSNVQKVVTEFNGLRAILAILIKLKNFMNAMQESISKDIAEQAKQKNTMVDQQQAVTNMQVAKNNANIDQIQKAIKEAAEQAKKSSVFGWLGIALSAIVLVATLVAAPFTGGASLALGIALFSAVVSAALLGVQAYEQASGNHFMENGLKNAFTDLMTDLRSHLPKGWADLIAAVIVIAMVVAVVMLTKGAGSAAAEAGASTAAKAAIVMATVSVAATVLASTNMISDTISDIAKDAGASKETAMILGAVLQAILIFAVSIYAGYLGARGGAAAAVDATESAADEAGEGAKAAKEAASAKSSSPDESAPSDEGDAAPLPDAEAAVPNFSSPLKEAEEAEKVAALAKEIKKEEAELSELKASVSELTEDLLSNPSKLSESLQKSFNSGMRLRQAAFGAQKAASGAQQISSILGDIFQGASDLAIAKAKKNQAEITLDLAQINALLIMIHSNLKQLDIDTSEMQDTSTQIIKEYSNNFDALNNVMPDMSKMMQKLFSSLG